MYASFLQPVLLSEECTNIIINLLNDKEVVLTAINKCRRELTPYGADNISVNYVFKIYFKTTSDSSVQWLQFRISHRILPEVYYL